MCPKASSSLSALLLSVFLCSSGASAAEQPIAIFHAFDQSFNDVKAFVCQLARQGYSHIQIPPAQTSNPKQPNHWFYRYQPVEFGMIGGRGSAEDLKSLIDKAASCDPPIKVIADVVFNHMASIQDGFSVNSFAEFASQDFHGNCPIYYRDGNRQTEHDCWLGTPSPDLPDLDQSRSNVRTVHKQHLKKLIDLGIGGFRFDAAKHMPEAIVKEYIDFVDTESNENTWNYLEVIDDNDTKAENYNWIAAVTDFVLYRSMKGGFTFSGDLRAFPPKSVADPRSVTFGENHDTIRQLNPYAIEPYDDRSDAHLATAFVLARESGTPLVFNEDNLVLYVRTGVRFRRIMHERRSAGLNVRENILKVIDSPTLLVMERGAEGFFVLNKATDKFDSPVLDLTLTNLEGCYRELRNDFTVAIERRGGQKYVTRWGTWSRGGMEVHGRDALYFVREPFALCQ